MKRLSVALFASLIVAGAANAAIAQTTPKPTRNLHKATDVATPMPVHTVNPSAQAHKSHKKP